MGWRRIALVQLKLKAIGLVHSESQFTVACRASHNGAAGPGLKQRARRHHCVAIYGFTNLDLVWQHTFLQVLTWNQNS